MVAYFARYVDAFNARAKFAPTGRIVETDHGYAIMFQNGKYYLPR